MFCIKSVVVTLLCTYCFDKHFVFLCFSRDESGIYHYLVQLTKWKHFVFVVVNFV